jgi:hypothetical protein
MTRPVGVFRLAVGNDDGARFLWPTRLAPMTSSGDRLRPNVISTLIWLGAWRANASGGARYDSETALIAESFRRQSSRPDQSCNRMPAKPRT